MNGSVNTNMAVDRHYEMSSSPEPDDGDPMRRSSSSRAPSYTRVLDQSSLSRSRIMETPEWSPASSVSTTPTTQDFFPAGRRRSSSFQADQPRPHTAHPTPQQNLQKLHKKPSEASRLRALNSPYGPGPEKRTGTPELYHPRDYSRYRQASMVQHNEPQRPTIQTSATFPLQANEDDHTHEDSPVMRERGISTSSSRSPVYYSPIPLRPSASIPDLQPPDSIYSRTRNLNNPTQRSPRGPVRPEPSRPDSNHSAVRQDLIRPGIFDGGELRSSFRSGLTTNSSYLGAGTERSSVVTKSSYTASINGKDEGMSVDDAIGMYELGFQDSGAEDNGGFPEPTHSEENLEDGRRQEYRQDENPQNKRTARVDESMSGFLLPPKPTTIIRDSTDMFSDVRNQETPSVADSSDHQNGYFNERPASRPDTGVSLSQDYDSTRDRYGFRKKTQYITQEQYDTWNKPYTEHLVRRKKKWAALMKESGLISDRPERFPPRNAKVKRFIRKGIPPDWRGNAWFYYAGGPLMLAKHPDVYKDLLRRAAAGDVSETDNEIIERDLNRTFPDNIRFKPDLTSTDTPGHETPILKSLRRVLQAFSIYNPRIGYCQSLNFLAGLLLLFMSEENSFWMLNIITRVYLPGTHEVNLEGANVDLGVLMMSVKESMPAIWGKIGGELDGSAGDGKVSMHLPPITLCCTAWFMSCFIGTLPIETTLRVWDSFFYEGSKTIFRIALAIFKVGEKEIRAVADPMEIFQVVQTIPRRLYDANALMDACFRRRNGFGHLSQATIESRRAERRAQYAQEREKVNGTVTTKPTMGRKNTLFARKKSKAEMKD